MTSITLRNLCALALAASMAVAPAVLHGDEAADPERVEQLEQRIAEIRERLALTGEQEEAIAPILKAGLEAQMAVMEKHGFDPEARADGVKRRRPGLRAARQLRRELDAVRADTVESLSEVLTPEQIEEYRKIQEESRQEMSRRLRENR